uniref:Uncharacterized protein n=1 Tax=Ursus americanus TaxID=9643 RepID=A0A452RLZ9_URSAM
MERWPWPSGGAWLLVAARAAAAAARRPAAGPPLLWRRWRCWLRSDWLCQRLLPRRPGLDLSGPWCQSMFWPRPSHRGVHWTSLAWPGCDLVLARRRQEVDAMGFTCWPLCWSGWPGALELRASCPSPKLCCRMDLTKPADIQPALGVHNRPTPPAQSVCDVELSPVATFRTLTKGLLPLLRPSGLGWAVSLPIPHPGDIAYPCLAAYGTLKPAMALLMDTFSVELPALGGFKVSVIQPCRTVHSFPPESVRNVGHWEKRKQCLLASCPRVAPAHGGHIEHLHGNSCIHCAGAARTFSPVVDAITDALLAAQAAPPLYPGVAWVMYFIHYYLPEGCGAAPTDSSSNHCLPRALAAGVHGPWPLLGIVTPKSALELA